MPHNPDHEKPTPQCMLPQLPARAKLHRRCASGSIYMTSSYVCKVVRPSHIGPFKTPWPPNAKDRPTGELASKLQAGSVISEFSAAQESKFALLVVLSRLPKTVVGSCACRRNWGCSGGCSHPYGDAQCWVSLPFKASISWDARSDMVPSDIVFSSLAGAGLCLGPTGRSS